MLRAQAFRITLSAIFCGALGSSIVAGHHSVAPYDRGSIRELEGVISGINWRNPHVRLTLTVTDEAKRRTEWELEGDSANAAARRASRAIRSGSAIGSKLRLAIEPRTPGAVRDQHSGPSGVETVLTDLNAPLRWTRGTAAPRVVAADAKLGRSIFRVWAPGALYEHEGRSRIPPRRKPHGRSGTAEGHARAQMHSTRDANANLNPYPIQFLDEGNRIRLRIEEWQATRSIDMVAKQIPAGAPASRLGYSIGRWKAARS